MDKEKEPTYEELKKENGVLRSELDKRKKNSKFKRKTAFWLGRTFFGYFIGRDLKSSVELGIDEYNSTKKISSENLSNIISNIIWRVTRVSLFTVLIALLPFFILIAQTKLLSNQNNKIDNQNVLIQNQNDLIQNQNKRLDQGVYLQEANRRSSLVYQFSNVMDAINEELKDEKLNPDRNLSRQLVGRIVSLSRSLKPYRYLTNDTLSSLISPERSQLLVSLVNAELGDSTYENIFSEGDFSYTELKDYTFRYIPFGGIHFDYSHFDNVNFMYCNFTGATLNNVFSDHVKFEYCDFNSLTMRNAHFEHLAIFTCTFKEEILFKNTYVKDLRFEDTSSRVSSFEDNFFESLLIMNSYSTYFDYSFNEKSVAKYFGKNKPEKYDILSENKKNLIFDNNAIGFSNSYFQHISTDETIFSKSGKDKGFKFQRFYLEKLNQKDTIHNFLDVNEYLLKYEKEPKESLVLIDTLRTPAKYLKRLKSNGLDINGNNYLSFDRFIKNVQELIDVEKEQRKTYTVESINL
ncbi:pentapeptide repeat-containing protein [Aquimarina macrocephali]|uniref:pentapeptide repeat-containing protein n=1 Tax=Aquimarina macrocephali TaxID=666563 RepID=UPI0004652CBC|nr:pentapeptide repeat-containing protein [Aquimarina macrocephali]